MPMLGLAGFPLMEFLFVQPVTNWSICQSIDRVEWMGNCMSFVWLTTTALFLACDRVGGGQLFRTVSMGKSEFLSGQLFLFRIDCITFRVEWQRSGGMVRRCRIEIHKFARNLLSIGNCCFFRLDRRADWTIRYLRCRKKWFRSRLNHKSLCENGRPFGFSFFLVLNICLAAIELVPFRTVGVILRPVL